MAPNESFQKQKTVMVPYNHKDRQSLSNKIINEKPKKSKPIKRDLRNWGIPLTVITKEQLRQKKRDNKNQKKKEVLQTLDKK